jgi:hypothetical protein
MREASEDAPCKILLATKAELGDQRSVSLDVLSTQIVEEATTLTNHHQQATPTVVVVLVVAEMFGEVSDSLGEQGNLHFGGTSVALVRAVFGHYFCWCLHYA